MKLMREGNAVWVNIQAWAECLGILKHGSCYFYQMGFQMPFCGYMVNLTKKNLLKHLNTQIVSKHIHAPLQFRWKTVELSWIDDIVLWQYL